MLQNKNLFKMYTLITQCNKYQNFGEKNAFQSLLK